MTALAVQVISLGENAMRDVTPALASAGVIGVFSPHRYEGSDPAKNWLVEGLEDLIILDYDSFDDRALGILFNLDEAAANRGLGILVLSQGDHNDDHATPDLDGGPYTAEGAKNPPWRRVVRHEECETALLEYVEWAQTA